MFDVANEQNGVKVVMPTARVVPFALPQAIARNLSDQRQHTRNTAAVEIKAMAKEMRTKHDQNGISKLVALLVRDFAQSSVANFRKGGLIGLAATAVGLVTKISDYHGGMVVPAGGLLGHRQYVKEIVHPVLVCFSDPDPDVRCCACESLCSIAEVEELWGDVHDVFDELFVGLCKLISDLDPKVREAAQVLDHLLTDICVELNQFFDIHTFIPLLRGRIKEDPFIRQFLIGWIVIPELNIELIELLPEFLDELFNMVSDPNMKIRQQTDAALADFLCEIHRQPDAADLCRMN